MSTNHPSNGASKSGFIAMLIGAALVAFLYFGLPNFYYLTDGLSAALDIRETPGWSIHPNHPLYPLLPQFFYRLMGDEAGGINELEFLQMWSISLGVLACLALMAAMRAGKSAVATTLVGLGLFAFMKGVWYHNVIPGPSSTALGPQVFALVAIALALRRPPEGPSRGYIVTIGLLTSLAILASQLNMVLLLPAGYAMVQGNKPLLKKVGTLFGFLAIVAIGTVGVIILASVALAGFKTPSEFLQWQYSYVYGSRWWIHGLADAIRSNWIGANEVIIAFPFREEGLFGDWTDKFGTTVWFMRLPIKVCQAVVLIFLLSETIRAVRACIRTRQLQPIQIVGLATALPLLFFSCIWTPGTTHYRILYIPGLLLFLLPALEQHYKLNQFSFKRAWPVLLAVLCLFVANFTNQFLPQSHPAGNPYLWEMHRLEESIGPGDLLICSGSGDGGMRALYAEYFLQCDTVRIHKLIGPIRDHPEDVLTDLRERHRSGAILLIHEDALFSQEDVEWMNRQHNMDIRPDEMRDFMSTWTITVRRFGFTGKEFIQFVPREPGGTETNPDE